MRYDGPANSYDVSRALAVDGSDNVYATGYSSNSDFTTDYATIKYDATGMQQWEARYDGPANSYDYASALAADGSGNIYVTGSSSNSDFTSDYATIKYNAAGVQQWEARYNGLANSTDSPSALAVDGSGNIYVTGYSSNSDFTTDYATIKYNAAGVEQWEARYDGPENFNDYAADLAVDGSGDIYVTGSSSNSDFTNDYATIKYNAAGVQQWEARYNGPANSSDDATALAIDGSGNVYVTGNSFGLGNDFATVKYSSTSGAELWSARYNEPEQAVDIATDMAVDGEGNVYVTGHVSTPGVDPDYLTVKYNASGILQWTARFNGPGNGLDVATDIAVDGSGNVYVTGLCAVNAATSDYDYATIQYDAAGVEQWVARYDGPANGYDQAAALKLDMSGNIYVTGFSTAPGTAHDYATIKYDATGAEEWVARYDGPASSYDTASDLVLDGAGNVYVTGHSIGNDGSFDCATIKYDAAGAEEWVARYAGLANDIDAAHALAVDGAGNVFITGESFVSGSGSDFLTAKYNAIGEEQWAALYDGPVLSSDFALDLALDNSGNVYVTGESEGIGDDFATIKYDAAGVQQWLARYNGPANNEDESPSLALDVAGNVYVTGQSVGMGTKRDYATIKYDAAGVQLCEARYNGPGNDLDVATDIAVDGSGNVYVAGNSFDLSNDFATIKYSPASLSLTADAGQDQTVDCGESAALGGSQTATGGTTPYSFSWTAEPPDPSLTSPTTEHPAVSPTVTTTYTLTVTDANNIIATDEVTITVGDNQPPIITVAAPRNLWPPNHQYVTIAMSQCVVSVQDGCRGSIPASNVGITKVTSDEPKDVNGGGDGNTVNDIVIASDCKSVQLRSERQGSGNGRVYTIHLSVQDGNGNTGTATCLVTVPKSQNGNPAIDDGPAYTVNGTCGGASAKISEGSSVESSYEVALPESYALQQNYPNPFNPETEIRFQLPEAGHVMVKIFDVLGSEVRTLVNEKRAAGYHLVRWDGKDEAGNFVASGVYLYQFRAGSFSQVRKMSLLR